MSAATIFAPATPPGRSGIAVLRLSGPETGSALAALIGGPLPPPRLAKLVKFRSANRGWLDRGLAIWFPAPASYTGEDMAEIHIHGGPAILAAMMAALGELGLRAAEPGEFTRRAFDRGKLDLVAIEGLADLIAAETEAQRRLALAQLEGELSDLYAGWRDRLVDALAAIEAMIDFPDEDLPQDRLAESAAMLARLGDEIARHLDDGRRGEILRDGFCVVILGAPNVGKSSLLNRLAGREAAIVSARAGTTRDAIEIRLDIAGYPILVVDTAGLRNADDEIEAEGQARAWRRARAADLKLVLAEPGRPLAAEILPAIDERTLLVLNKADLPGDPPDKRGWLAVSAKTGAGLDALIAAIGDRARAALDRREGPALTRARHRAALAEALSALRRAEIATAPELQAEDLRLAARALGRVIGTVDVEDVLDRLFSAFCIGK